jgi:hypothetical protein
VTSNCHASPVVSAARTGVAIAASIVPKTHARKLIVIFRRTISVSPLAIAVLV